MIVEEDLLERLVGQIAAVLGDELISIYLHGSFTTSDFTEHRSNVNLLVIVRRDPDEAMRRRLQDAQDATIELFPQWSDHLEVEYVSQEALTGFAERPHVELRCTENRPLRLTPVTQLGQLTWYTVRETGSTLYGPPPAEVIPPISMAEFLAAVRGHAALWPAWVREHTDVHSQVYAVMVMCRAWYSIRRKGLASKREAALFTAADCPRWAGLVHWAELWWFEGGRDDEPGRLDEVIAFVDDIAVRVQQQAEPASSAATHIAGGSGLADATPGVEPPAPPHLPEPS
jgi:predicted nucleotidyltransferase